MRRAGGIAWRGGGGALPRSYALRAGCAILAGMPVSGRSHQPFLTAPPVAGIPYPFVALGLVVMGQVLASIDMSTIIFTLPELSEAFNAGTNSILWVPLVFTLLTTALGLSSGRLGDLYGRKRVYMLGLVLFGLSPLFSSIAGTLPELVAARVIHGVGAALVVGNAAAIIAASFPAQRRGLPLGIMSAMTGFGMALGPILAGLLVQEFDWRAVFWTRIPFGFIAALLVWRFLVDVPAERRPRGLDVRGSVLLFAALLSLVLAVNRGEAWGWFSLPVLGMFATSLVLLPLFVVSQRRAPSPVLALDLFRVPSFSAGTATILLQFIGFASVLFLLPFILIEARGFSALEAGAIASALPLSLLVVSPLAGVLTDRVGPRSVMMAGLMTMAVGTLFLSTVTTATPVAGLVVRLSVVGLGAALFQTPNIIAIMSAVAPDRLGTASGAVMTFRQIGQSIGIAVAGALFTARATDIAASRSAGGLDDLAVRPEAFIGGFELAMFVAAGVATAALVAAWFTGRRGGRPPPASAPVVEQRVPSERAD